MLARQPAGSRDAPTRLGRYELIGQLATGGMAEIHLARLAGEAGFEKIVVVKRLLPELVASPTYVAMFTDEGKLVSRLDHPNICEVYELGRDGAEYYLAMPYLDGLSVHELIARPRDPDRTAQLRVAAGVIVQACAGLHHAHELLAADGAPANLVHRDVSPSNLFATVSGTVKVLDFGIAKVRGAAATEAGMIKGKAQYMAPEQLLGDPVDRRCDIFALGIVLYELATHQRLFKRPSDYLAAKAILEDPIPRADAADPAVPAALADVIAKALSRNPADRHATTRELGDAVVAAITPASPSEIGAMVTASDELSAQRTRQARVLDVARSRVSAVDAPTRDLRAPATDVVTATRARSSRIDRPLAIAALVAALVGVLVIAWRLQLDDPPVIATLPSTPPPTATTPPAVALHQPAAPPTQTRPSVPDQPAIAAATTKPTELRRPSPNGLLSIDSTPYATIFVDGTRLGITPLVKRSLPAGRHKLRAVLADGRSKDLTLDVPTGKLAAPIQLTW